MSVKTVVHYVRESLEPVRIGYSAHLRPIDHTSPLVSNQGLARTSPVVAHDPITGRVETRNSIYLPDTEDGE